MTWKLPPRIKIYEALGCIADQRITMEERSAKVQASSGGKQYDVIFDPEQKMISANDNGSYWQGYLGYPAIAFLMKKGLLLWDQPLAESLKGIAWKELNTFFKNDWKKTEQWIYENMFSHDATKISDLEHFAGEVAKQIDRLGLNKPLKRQFPPRN